MKSLGILLLLLASATVTAAGTVEFSGEIVKSEGLRVLTGTIHVKGDAYRLEFADPGGPTIVSIANPKADTVRVLVPRYKLYMEGKYTGRLARMNDPFASLARMREHFESKDGGVEKIGGHECAREDLCSGGSPSISVWRSTKLGFPLKVAILTQKGYWTEIGKIRESAVAEDLMKVPADYVAATRDEIRAKILADPEMKAKREAWEKVKPRSAKFGTFLRPGDRWVLLLGRVTEAIVGVKYGKDSVWWAIPHRDGKARKTIEAATIQGPGTVTFGEKDAPEMITIGAGGGSPGVRVELTGSGLLLLAHKSVVVAKNGANRDWTVGREVKRLVVTFTAGETAIRGEFTFTKDGQHGKQPLDVAPGTSTSFEFTDADKVTNAAYHVNVGTGTIEIVTDMRAGKDRKPF